MSTNDQLQTEEDVFMECLEKASYLIDNGYIQDDVIDLANKIMIAQKKQSLLRVSEFPDPLVDFDLELLQHVCSRCIDCLCCCLNRALHRV